MYKGGTTAFYDTKFSVRGEFNFKNILTQSSVKHFLSKEGLTIVAKKMIEDKSEILFNLLISYINRLALGDDVKTQEVIKNIKKEIQKYKKN